MNTSGAASLAALLLELYPRLIKELRCGIDSGGSYELTLPQWRILACLADEPITNKSLAEAIGVSVAATSRMVDGLLERGLMLRSPDPRDKRQCYLSLTNAGRRSALAFRRSAEKVLAHRLKALPETKLQRAAESFAVLLEAFPQPSLARPLSSEIALGAGQAAPNQAPPSLKKRFKAASGSAPRLR